MSPPRCSAFMCGKSTKDGVSLHKFPENFSHLWIFAVDRGPTWLPKSNSRLCSDHFNKEDFEIISKSKSIKEGRQPFPVKATSISEQDKILIASRIKLETLRRDELAANTEKENFEKLKRTNPDLWTIINILKTMKGRLEVLAMQVNRRIEEFWGDNDFRLIINQVDSVHRRLETFIKKNRGYSEKIQLNEQTPKLECVKEEVDCFSDKTTLIENNKALHLPSNVCEDLILECENEDIFSNFDKEVIEDSMFDEETIINITNEFHNYASKQPNIEDLETTSEQNFNFNENDKENEIVRITGFDKDSSEQLDIEDLDTATIEEVNEKGTEICTDKDSALPIDSLVVVDTIVTEINGENDMIDDKRDNIVNTDPQAQEKQLLCLVCNESFHSELIRKHVFQDHGNGPYQCKRCEGTSENYEELEKHTIWHSKQCDICLKNFSSNASMKAHRRIHTETEQPCEICQKLIFPFKMGQHISKYHEEWRHKCDFCEKKFAKPHSLRLHLRMHTGERPYKCNTCGDSFKQGAHLRTHIGLKHEGKKLKKQKQVKTMCGVCGKLCSSALAYKEHERTHTGERPYKCDKCDKAYANREKLKLHIEVYHSDKSFSCDQCGKILKHSKAFKTHMKTHEPNYVAHTFSCDDCCITYKNRFNLRRHMRVFHEGIRPYSCDVCNQSFSNTNILKQHKRIHTGEKPYNCEECGKSFTQDSSLYMHKKKCH